MSDAPWTITSTKRKSNKRATSPRKRTKRAHDASMTNNDHSMSRPQQTLTQIDFVTNSLAEDDAALLDLEPLPIISPQSEGSRAPRSLKRDSTLTQMDFGNSFGSTGKRRSPTMQPPARRPTKRSKKRDSTLTQMDFFNANMDGASGLEETMLSTPKKSTPRLQKMVDDLLVSDAASMTSLREKVGSSVSSPETQEYRPGKRKQKEGGGQLHLSKRRRSNRIAAASTPTVQEDIPQPASAKRRTPATAPRRPVLEIQDSTDFQEELIGSVQLAQSVKLLTPSTPPKNNRGIPSSQTPESLSRHVTGRPLSSSRTVLRQPLTELSSNLRMPDQKIALHKSRTIDLFGHKTPKRSPPRKICTLKLSREALSTVEWGYGESAKEHDIYSVQATSSPTRQGSSPRKEASSMTGKATTTEASSGGPTIRETASSQRQLEIEESLPDISDILNISRIAADNGGHEDPLIDPITPTKQSRGSLKEKHKALNNPANLVIYQGPTNMIPELEQEVVDDMSSFGTPVANDTQFIKNLYERLSSPIAATHLGDERPTTVPLADSRSPVIAKVSSRASLPASPPKRSPLPAPKLVQTSPAAPRLPRQATASSDLRALPSASTQTRSLENVQTSLVPLNDTFGYQQSSSSPSLPPVPSSSGRAVARLASIPHPSQISTQAPSQGLFPTSSAPQTFSFPQDSEIERITLKDSSSYHPRLSQMDQHFDNDDELSEGDLDLLDELRDEEELDLDPLTAPAGLPRTQMEITRDNHHTKEEDVTQTPTQKSRGGKTPGRRTSSIQSSPIITNATTRSQRDAKLEVVTLISSSSPSGNGPQIHSEDNGDKDEEEDDNNTTLHPYHSTPTKPASTTKGKSKTPQHTLSSPSSSSSMYSPSPPRDLKRKYTPLPGFNNDTQSDFTQNGSVTAAYVHRMWDRGHLPRSFVPRPYKVRNFTKGMSRRIDAG